MLEEIECKFYVGQLIQHQLFNYRGVVVDVDPEFEDTEEWYEKVARSRPPKDKPWYHVLVHNAKHTTYVAECNLTPDVSRLSISHPLVDRFFTQFKGGKYIRPMN